MENLAKKNIKKIHKKIIEEDVIAFLENNSSFLLFHEELAKKLEMPVNNNENIVSIGDFEIQKWKKKAQKLETQNKLLVKTSIFNLESEGLLRNIIIEIAQAENFNELTNILNIHLKEGMKLDNVSFITDSETQNLFNDNEIVKLRTIYKNEDAFMHEQLEKDIASDALLKLELNGEYYGMLALGSFDQARFHAGQGSELLEFFAKILTVHVKRLLS